MLENQRLRELLTIHHETNDIPIEEINKELADHEKELQEFEYEMI
jgi:hypothetical protein